MKKIFVAGLIVYMLMGIPSVSAQSELSPIPLSEEEEQVLSLYNVHYQLSQKFHMEVGDELIGSTLIVRMRQWDEKEWKAEESYGTEILLEEDMTVLIDLFDEMMLSFQGELNSFNWNNDTSFLPNARQRFTTGFGFVIDWQDQIPLLKGDNLIAHIVSGKLEDIHNFDNEWFKTVDYTNPILPDGIETLNIMVLTIN